MKVLFQNRDPKSWIGGDHIQLEQTRKAVESLGVQTDFSHEYIASPEHIMDADVVHCCNFTSAWTKYQIWNASKLGKKVVCSMIYHETDEFIDYRTQQAMINELSACFFLTEGERDRALRHLDISAEKIHIIENGIEEWWFDVPRETIQSDVLTVGRIDANKGQLAVAQACKELGLTYTCVGEPSAYAELCRNEGAIIIPSVDQKELLKYYAGTKVFALVSYKEVFPLTVMEAGAQGKPIVLTSGCEWDIDRYGVLRANYNDVASIKESIQKALKTPNIAFREHLKDMKWSDVAKKYLSVYESIL